MTIPPQHVETLVRLGYTPEEARFIYIVAIHSGYFTHRQFLQFADAKPGKHSHKFVEKLLGHKHATAHNYQSGARVYHIFSRRLFNSIGHDNLRTRRKHQLDYIKTRLMALDFVLSNPSLHYLETEADKVPYFEQRLRVSRSVLPSRTYTSKVSLRSTTRYFVDRFPMCVDDPASPFPAVTFTYLDPDFATLDGFTTHLRAYVSLFESLQRFELIYVNTSERAFPLARLDFSRTVLGAASRTTTDDVLCYFALRRAWEAGERVEAADVVLFNRARSRFRNEEAESLYRKWCQGVAGDAEFNGLLRTAPRESRGSISTVLGGESLSIFRRSSEEPHDRRTTKSGGPVSPRFSPEVSLP
jgi:hypothetical protein